MFKQSYQFNFPPIFTFVVNKALDIFVIYRFQDLPPFVLLRGLYIRKAQVFV